MADSWKSDGNCEVCRRKNYCTKSCTAHKKAVIDHICTKVAEKYGEETARGIPDAVIVSMLMASVLTPDDKV